MALPMVLLIFLDSIPRARALFFCGFFRGCLLSSFLTSNILFQPLFSKISKTYFVTLGGDKVICGNKTGIVEIHIWYI